MTSPPQPRRRRRTRGILVVTVLGLLAVLAGTEALLRVKPLDDTAHLQVEGLPPLASATGEVDTCRREDEESVEDVATRLISGGRITSTQVYACPAAFDGLRVVYAGEVIGELLQRRGGVWAQVNDDAYALEVGPLGNHRERRGFNTGLSVWLPDGLHEQIAGVGRPERRGDVVVLEGVLHRADPADGGGITLRADQLEVLAPTIETPDPLHGPQAVVAAVLAAAAVLALEWRRRARQR